MRRNSCVCCIARIFSVSLLDIIAEGKGGQHCGGLANTLEAELSTGGLSGRMLAPMLTVGIQSAVKVTAMATLIQSLAARRHWSTVCSWLRAESLTV